MSMKDHILKTEEEIIEEPTYPPCLNAFHEDRDAEDRAKRIELDSSLKNESHKQEHKHEHI